MKICCISDTHTYQDSIDRSLLVGDILICAGDITHRGSLSDIEKFNTWLGTLNFKYKILISGNHDFAFQNKSKEAKSIITNAIYLQDELVEIEGLKIYGSPWQPWFHDWAFNAGSSDLIKVWNNIPQGIDILVTHGPPKEILDITSRKVNAGCNFLREKIEEIKPKLHIFGHIHEAYGVHKTEDTTYVNCSICTLKYKPDNKPIVVET